MATPVEQFPIESAMMMTDEDSRSPAPSPMRHPAKRHRRPASAAGSEAESDCQESQESGLSQSRGSQGDRGLVGRGEIGIAGEKQKTRQA